MVEIVSAVEKHFKQAFFMSVIISSLFLNCDLFFFRLSTHVLLLCSTYI